VADVPGFLSELDLAVLSSRAEGMPNAVLEYMAAARPIVATAVGGTTALLQDQVNARLVPPESHELLAGAIVELLENPQDACRLAEASRKHVESCRSRSKLVSRYEDLYLELASSFPAGRDDG
jgi:glycosyltransferase involved in cell wall biosynthesis